MNRVNLLMYYLLRILTCAIYVCNMYNLPWLFTYTASLVPNQN